jgi:sterol desaturase/sphingolipid hydroxylase (fatty acid hydroxylase superfamily)
MNATGILLSTGVSFLLLFLLFRPLELLFPAKKRQKFLRPVFWTDLFFFLGQYLLWKVLVFAAIQWSDGWLMQWISGGFRENVRTQPLWLQIAEVILLTDLLIYWGQLWHPFRRKPAAIQSSRFTAKTDS